MPAESSLAQGLGYSNVARHLADNDRSAAQVRSTADSSGETGGGIGQCRDEEHRPAGVIHRRRRHSDGSRPGQVHLHAGLATAWPVRKLS